LELKKKQSRGGAGQYSLGDILGKKKRKKGKKNVPEGN